MARTKTKRFRYIQFVEYLISGGVYFWVGSLLLDFLYYYLHWNLWWATIISNLVGWTANFLLQRYWVFRNPALRGHLTAITGRYVYITIVDFVLNYFILYGLRAIGITPAIGQFISAGLFTPWNYLWYRYWVFPERLAKRRPVRHGLFRLFAHRPHGHGAYHTVK